LKKLLSALLWLFCLFYAYSAIFTLWWIYDPATKERDATPLFAYFTFFQLPVALLMGVVIYRDVRRLLVKRSELATGLRLALFSRATLASAGVAVTAWMLIVGLLRWRG